MSLKMGRTSSMSIMSTSNCFRPFDSKLKTSKTILEPDEFTLMKDENRNDPSRVGEEVARVRQLFPDSSIFFDFDLRTERTFVGEVVEAWRRVEFLIVKPSVLDLFLRARLFLAPDRVSIRSEI